MQKKIVTTNTNHSMVKVIDLTFKHCFHHTFTHKLHFFSQLLIGYIFRLEKRKQYYYNQVGNEKKTLTKKILSHIIIEQKSVANANTVIYIYIVRHYLYIIYTLLTL